MITQPALNTPLPELKFKTNANRKWIFLSVIGIVLSAALTVALVVIVLRSKQKPKICTTPTCIQTASHILENLDPNIDPCDNFYQFACGKYLKSAVIPEGKTGVSMFSQASDHIKNQLNLLYEEPLSKNSSRPAKLLKTIYNLCTNTEKNNLNGIKDALGLFKEAGGWPLLEGEGWNPKTFEWHKINTKLRKMGTIHDLFFTIGVLVHSKNTNKYDICIDKGLFSLLRYFHNGFNDTIVQAFYDYLIDVSVIMGANSVTAKKEIKDVIDFKIKLSRIFHKTANAPINVTIKELQEQFPKMNWLDYIRNILDLPQVNVTNGEFIVLHSVDYVTQVLLLLEQTPKRTLANFVNVNILFSIVPYLTDKLKARDAALIKLINPHYTVKSVSEECRLVSYQSVGLQVDHFYVTNYFDNKVKSEVEQITSNVRKEFVGILKKADWLDAETRAYALEKILAMKEYIAYPSELLDPNNVDKYYHKLEINSTSYLRAILSVKRFLQDIKYDQLRNSYNHSNWLHHTTPLMVNAFYDPVENSINFPAGILQGIFYNKDRPKYVNYGVIGSIIGHELTHGFDNLGRLYDKDGERRNWWSKNTEKLFISKAQCIIDQYNNYTYKPLNTNVNGIRTQGEAIADNGGVKESYYAYNTWMKKNGPEERLPGLDYTPQQLFWISLAQVWCGKYDNRLMRNVLENDPHPPPEFRVIGPFSNSENFTADFKCSINSTMNRKNKCSVW